MRQKKKKKKTELDFVQQTGKINFLVAFLKQSEQKPLTPGPAGKTDLVKSQSL